jgi:hypothetical protein
MKYAVEMVSSDVIYIQSVMMIGRVNQVSDSLFNTEDRSTISLPNVDKLPPDLTVSHPTK